VQHEQVYNVQQLRGLTCKDLVQDSREILDLDSALRLDVLDIRPEHPPVQVFLVTQDVLKSEGNAHLLDLVCISLQVELLCTLPCLVEGPVQQLTRIQGLEGA